MADRLPSRPPRTNWGNLSKNLALWLLVGLLALALFQMMSRQRNPTQEFSYTEFSRQLDQGNIARVEIFDGKRLEGDFKNGVTKEEISEILLQAAIYSGVPAAVDAFRVARRVLTEEGALS